MAFDQGAPNGIARPDNWFGVGDFELSNGTVRTAWDGAHATGDAFWRREMGEYQNALDPDGSFKFDPDARWNGALVSNRTIDGGASGTTAHGNHGQAVNEISWSSDQNKPSFFQSVLDEFNDTVDGLEADFQNYGDSLLNALIKLP